MTVCAIYSAGPNLERTMRFGFPMSIAINSALARLPADFQPHWYSAGDVAAYTPEFTRGRKPKIGWCCMDPVTRHRVTTRFPEWADLPHWVWPELPGRAEADWTTYTISATYLFASMLGATECVVFGDDQIDDGEMVQAPNGSGRLIHRYPNSRKEREDREREAVLKLVKLKVTPVRIQPS